MSKPIPRAKGPSSWFPLHWRMKIFNIWPPFLFGGVRVGRISSNLREVEMILFQRPWNRNYVGTHFGGLLYALVDAPYMIMFLENLGPGHVVWDKAATIRFKKPGRGTVRAQFRLTQQQIDEVRAQFEREPRFDRTYTVAITDDAGDTVAEVDKVLYFRKH